LEYRREPEGAAEGVSSDAVELSEGEGAREVVVVAVDDGCPVVGMATDDVASGPAAGWPPESRRSTARRSCARHGGGAQRSSARPDRTAILILIRLLFRVGGLGLGYEFVG
jgi:hypothetical protein